MRTDDELPAWLNTLRDTLSDPGTPYRFTQQERRPAAVLILFGEGADGPDLLFIERSSLLRSHPGQMAFPGGGFEPDDHDLAATALREAHEETGLDPDGVDVFGELATIEVPISGYRVTPELGWWRRPSPVTAADPGEVASVHRIPIAELTEPANRFAMTHPSGRIGPGFLIGDLLIWGLTAHMVNGVLSRGGWQRPWDRHRTMAVPQRYLGRPENTDPGPDVVDDREDDLELAEEQPDDR
ncbi:NUDIX hydrolase [Microlunatus elymi]|uniref:NUDIX hydrolase n=1 Tax=Microlunatus elymi TaxID=2596828 RepID=UPI00143E0141|nr:CoA pyrophosphatase [Microlunatus elymi]